MFFILPNAELGCRILRPSSEVANEKQENGGTYWGHHIIDGSDWAFHMSLTVAAMFPPVFWQNLGREGWQLHTLSLQFFKKQIKSPSLHPLPSTAVLNHDLAGYPPNTTPNG